MVLLAFLFAVTALLYASVGFAGGSTYNALLALAGVDHRVFPVVALACNLIVASGGAWRFARARLVPWRRLWPMLALSMPAAWIGGALPVSEQLFLWLLGGALLVAALLLIVQPEGERAGGGGAVVGPAVAAPIGLLSGIVGVGGGVFLAPVLHLIGWDRAKRVAATASVFILANSVAGLAGQATKLAARPELVAAAGYWPLGLAVLVGGQVGSRIGVALLPPVWLRRMTGALILYVAVRLLLQAARGG